MAATPSAMMNPATRTALSDALAMAAGVEVGGDSARQAAMQYQGLTLHGLARACIGDSCYTEQLKGQTLYERAISTGSFPEILGTAANKTLSKSFTEYPSTFLQWCGRRQSPDLKSHKDIRLSAFASMPVVGDGGELEHGDLSESRESYEAVTRGLRFALTRKMWINDDVGAFLDIPRKLGALAVRTIDDIAYALLVSQSGLGPTLNADSEKLFSASHKSSNYATGDPDSVLSDAGLTALKLLFTKTLGDAEEFVNVMPRFLLVPPELDHTALKLIHSQELMVAKAGTTDATTILPTANIHRGTLIPIVEPRLSGATDGTTAWYLIGDPRQTESLILVTLIGKEAPTVERADPPNILGIGWRVYHDAGVAAVDYRGIARAKGAA